jgi:hypothetical protein
MSWSRPIALLAVLAGLGLAGGALALRAPAAAPLDPAGLETTLTDILRQVYAAFSERDEGRIYDRLAAVADDELVPQLYLQRRAAQIADYATDGETEVLSVEPFRVDAEASPDGRGYRVDAAWRVVGRIRHQAHVHERINLYAANLTIVDLDGRWKLTAFRLTEAERADAMAFEGGE